MAGSGAFPPGAAPRGVWRMARRHSSRVEGAENLGARSGGACNELPRASANAGAGPPFTPTAGRDSRKAGPSGQPCGNPASGSLERMQDTPEGTVAQSAGPEGKCAVRSGILFFPGRAGCRRCSSSSPASRDGYRHRVRGPSVKRMDQVLFGLTPYAWVRGSATSIATGMTALYGHSHPVPGSRCVWPFMAREEPGFPEGCFLKQPSGNPGHHA